MMILITKKNKLLDCDSSVYHRLVQKRGASTDAENVDKSTFCKKVLAKE